MFHSQHTDRRIIVNNSSLSPLEDSQGQMTEVSPWKPTGRPQGCWGGGKKNLGSWKYPVTSWCCCERASETLKLPSGAPRLKAVSYLVLEGNIQRIQKQRKGLKILSIEKGFTMFCVTVVMIDW